MVLDIILTVAAVIAAAFAGWQAWIARGARKDAGASESAAATSATEAAATAKESAGALARSAAALERSNELVEEARKPIVKASWQLHRRGEITYIFLNTGNATAIGVTVEEIQDAQTGWLRTSAGDFPRDVAPGHTFEVSVVSAWGSPTVILQLKWREQDGDTLTDLKTADITLI